MKVVKDYLEKNGHVDVNIQSAISAVHGTIVATFTCGGMPDVHYQHITPLELINFVYEKIVEQNKTSFNVQDEMNDLFNRVVQNLCDCDTEENNDPEKKLTSMLDDNIISNGQKTPDEMTDMLNNILQNGEFIKDVSTTPLTLITEEFKKKQGKQSGSPNIKPTRRGRGKHKNK